MFIKMAAYKDDEKKYKHKWKNTPNLNKNILYLMLVVCIVILFHLFVKKDDDIDIEARKILKLTKRECLKNYFNDFALIIAFDQPYYKDITFIRKMYEDVFGQVIICGPEPDASSGRYLPDIEFETDRGLYGYNCLGKAAEIYTNFSGFFFINYDVIVNWWNLKKYDTSKIWMLENNRQLGMKKLRSADLKSCQGYLTFLQRISSMLKFESLLGKYTNNKQNIENNNCISRPSKFLYIPKKYMESYSMLSNGAYVNKLEQNTGVHSIIQALVDEKDVVQISEYYQPHQYRFETSPLFWKKYKLTMEIAHSFRLYRKNKVAWEKNKFMVYQNYLTFSKKLTNC